MARQRACSLCKKFLRIGAINGCANIKIIFTITTIFIYPPDHLNIAMQTKGFLSDYKFVLAVLLVVVVGGLVLFSQSSPSGYGTAAGSPGGKASPAILKATYSPSAQTLTWAPMKGASYYKVNYQIRGSTSWKAAYYGDKITTTSTSLVLPRGNYVVRVLAYDSRNRPIRASDTLVAVR